MHVSLTSRCAIVELKESAEAIVFCISSFCTHEADLKKFEPKLHMNSDGLVLEYNDAETGHKMFEKISGVKKNNS